MREASWAASDRPLSVGEPCSVVPILERHTYKILSTNECAPIQDMEAGCLRVCYRIQGRGPAGVKGYFCTFRRTKDASKGQETHSQHHRLADIKRVGQEDASERRQREERTQAISRGRKLSEDKEAVIVLTPGLALSKNRSTHSEGSVGCFYLSEAAGEEVTPFPPYRLAGQDFLCSRVVLNGP